MRSLLVLLLAIALLGCGMRGSEILLGSESHGTGGASDRYNPWFLEARGTPEKIPYCIEVDASSKYTAAEYAKMVSDAIELWQAFFKRYGFADRFIGRDPDILQHFPDGRERRLSLGFEPIEKCTNLQNQLRFLFGPKPPMGDAIDRHWSTALGSAVRGPYDHKTFRTGGTVWIHNRPSEGRKVPPRAFRHIILHELGHVLGVRHNETWCMYEDAAEETFKRLSLLEDSYPGDLGIVELSDWRFRILPKDEIRFSRFKSSVQSNGNQEQRLEWFALWGEGVSIAHFVNATLRYDGDAAYGRRNFTLLLAAPLKTTIEIPGQFTAERTARQPALALGPGVFTHWLEPEGERNALLAFYGAPPLTPANGFFKFNGKFFPAVMKSRYGLSLVISMPEKRGWTQFQSVERRGRIDDED